MMPEQIEGEIREFRAEAAESRQLAASFKDRRSIADLLSYASALEADAAEWEGMLRLWEFLGQSKAA
jgi:hypothetical protein